MTQRYSPAELALLTLLADAFDRLDPIPAEVTAAACRAGATACRPETGRRWELLWDTAVEPLAVALRGPGDGRMISFGDHVGTLELRFEPAHATRLRLTGLVSTGPDQRATAVSVRWPDGELRATVDDIGRFDADGLPSGPLRLAVHDADQAFAVTPWFVG